MFNLFEFLCEFCVTVFILFYFIIKASLNAEKEKRKREGDGVKGGSEKKEAVDSGCELFLGGY